jgi:hypothetical protein
VLHVATGFLHYYFLRGKKLLAAAREGGKEQYSQRAMLICTLALFSGWGWQMAMMQ